mgnify:CR=1 FL=1
MHKIPNRYEAPIDSFLFIFVERIAPYMSIISPNLITTVGVIFDIIGFYLLYSTKYYLFGIGCFIIGYFMDCLDGYIARRYNKMTVFGDWYDHITDVMKGIGILYLLYHFNPKLGVVAIPFILGFCYITIYHILYQETIYGNNSESPSLNLIKYITGSPTIKQAEQNIIYTRYFGIGQLQLLMYAFVLYFAYNKA